MNHIKSKSYNFQYLRLLKICYLYNKKLSIFNFYKILLFQFCIQFQLYPFKEPSQDKYVYGQDRVFIIVKYDNIFHLRFSNYLIRISIFSIIL